MLETMTLYVQGQWRSRNF